MSEVFKRSFQLIVGIEGGFSKDPRDRGNWTGGKVNVGKLRGTKYGVSAAAYPELDIENLTLDDACALYFVDYWRPLRADDMPPPIAFIAFDGAINAGVSASAKFLQRALRVNDDGKIGAQTLGALKTVRDLKPLIAEMLAQRNLHNTNAPTFPTHGLGWSRRLFTISYQALIF